MWISGGEVNRNGVTKNMLNRYLKILGGGSVVRHSDCHQAMEFEVGAARGYMFDETEKKMADLRRNLRSFLDEFLHVIFAEAAVAGVVNLADNRHWLRLAHGDDANPV
nr:hypothetical protein Iba_chr06cCG2520 [Ipomoea batatas]